MSDQLVACNSDTLRRKVTKQGKKMLCWRRVEFLARMVREGLV